MKTALITGISGQDGAYLAKLLLEKGNRVVGTSRDAQVSQFSNLDRLGIRSEVELESVALNDFRSVIRALVKVQPDEIYNLAGQSSVSLSFDQPVEAQESIYVASLNLLRLFVSLEREPKFTMPALANALEIWAERPPMKTLPSGREALMRSPRPRHFGRLLTIGKPTGFLPVPGFCSIMKAHFDRRDLSPKRSS
jgi:GDPmannose 4,6-dehydratase